MFSMLAIAFSILSNSSVEKWSTYIPAYFLLLLTAYFCSRNTPRTVWSLSAPILVWFSYWIFFYQFHKFLGRNFQRAIAMCVSEVKCQRRIHACQVLIDNTLCQLIFIPLWHHFLEADSGLLELILGLKLDGHGRVGALQILVHHGDAEEIHVDCTASPQCWFSRETHVNLNQPLKRWLSNPQFTVFDDVAFASQ